MFFDNVTITKMGKKRAEHTSPHLLRQDKRSCTRARKAAATATDELSGYLLKNRVGVEKVGLVRKPSQNG